MSEDLTGEIEKTPSHDGTAESSTAPEAEVKPEGQAEASATETPDEPKVNKVQQRINQLTREKHEQRQENAELKARLEKLEQVKPEAKVIDLVAPDQNDFDTDQDYHAANAKYYAEVSGNAAQARLTAADSESREEVTRSARQKELEVKKAGFEEKLAGIRENFEDFEEVAYGNTQFMDMDLAEQLFDLDKGPEVAYHLGSHLDEAERIFALSPVQRARELTKLEFQVEALAPKKVSDAPDPISPLGSSETIQTDPDKMNANEWQAWRNKQLHG